MPTAPHDALHHVFRDDPDLVNRTLYELCGTDLQVAKVAEINIDATELRPLERRADTVLRIESADQGPFVLIVESQTRTDDDKLRAWPQLVTHLYAKHRLPVALLIITQSSATEIWARRPIVCRVPGLPPTFQLITLVMGPTNTRRVTRLAEAAADIGFTVLSALVHGRSKDVDGILRTLMEALGTIDVSTAIAYAEHTEAALQHTPAALTLWKALMKTSTQPFVSELRAEAEAQGEARGEARGEAKMLLRFLEIKGITVTQEARARIIGCTDARQFDEWALRCEDITTIDELFA